MLIIITVITIGRKPMPAIPRRLVRRLGALTAATALVVGLSPAVAHAAPQEPKEKVLTPAQAVARGTGASEGKVARKLQREAGQTAAARQLRSQLGKERQAGSWISADGRLHIAVTDRSGAEAVRRAGATAVEVRHSERVLEQVIAKLDAAAEAGKINELHSWGIDPETNKVVITTAGMTEGGAAAQLVAAAAGDDTVRVEKSAAKPRLSANLYGGREYTVNGQWRCSTGFNATDGRGRTVMLTAGHCTEGGSQFAMNGTSLGTLRGTSFPGNDYSAINVSSSWTAQGVVDMYDGYGVRVKGSTEATVGATLCKSGRTTGWTCGEVVSFDNTVNYGNGDVVYGLTRHDACVEQGDSGGSNMSGGQAQGFSSGGALYENGSGQLVCGEKVGQENISYFQPVNEALSRYGVSLITA
ncbi:S1 family peptidase [Microlunatus sp. Y2014]|uniref:S1 family peptidase n=1 Tax=Microlunatus sp. Y2014 TaxID=3418488 RepID=UPI003DA7A1A6